MLEFRHTARGHVVLWVLVGLTVSVLALFLFVRVVGPAPPPLPVIGRVTGFQFTNQAGAKVASAAWAGRPWLADLIFTRCPGPCVRLTRNLVELQSRLKSSAGLRLVSFTADPEFDTPTVLKAYGEKLGADFRGWDFLTGPRTSINAVVTGQLLLAVMEKDPAEREEPNDLYLHSTKWVLVDGQGRLRAVYEGTEPGSVGQVLRDLRQLEAEPIEAAGRGGAHD